MADQAHTTSAPSPSRRALVRALPALATIPFLGLPASAEPVHPDAELLALCAQLEVADAHQEAMSVKWGLSDCIEADDECAAAHDAAAAIVDRMEALPARTVDGIFAKARAVAWCRSKETFEIDRQRDATDERLAMAVINDLWAIAAARA